MLNQNSNSPVDCRRLLQLQQLGVNASSIKYNNISMGSDRCIVINEYNKLLIANISQSKLIPLNNNSVDAAIMNPVSNVLALRSNNHLQIFNLDIKTQIKNIKLKFDDNEHIIYWKWLNKSTISYITSKSVYHWSMQTNSSPSKMFDHNLYTNSNKQIQIINYNSSKDGNWLFIQCITKSQTNSNSVEGILQLYNVPSKKYQPKMNATGGCFAYLDDSTLFCFTKQSKLFMIEIGNNSAVDDNKQQNDDNNNNNNKPLKIQSDIEYEEKNDFMMAMIPSIKYGCIYCISQAGFLFIFDIQSGKSIFKQRISSTTIFNAVYSANTGGIVSLNSLGNVLLTHINEDKYVEYILNNLNDTKLGISLAMKYNLPGNINTNKIFLDRFNLLISQSQYQNAIIFAANSPKQLLRTSKTIKIFQNLPDLNGTPVDMLYFKFLLKQYNKLNKEESIGLCKRILQAVKLKEAIIKIEQCLTENQLENCEELGDLLARYDAKLAASVYYRSHIYAKTILCFIKSGAANKVIQYCKNENYQPNSWKNILINVQNLKRNDTANFAKQLIKLNYLNINDIINILLNPSINDIEKTTEILLDYFKENGDNPKDFDLQTKLFEINLNYSPKVADAIFESNEYILTNYDKNYIASLCESAKLYNRALLNYDTLNDIKRCLQIGISSNMLNINFLIKYFGDLTPSDALSCLKDLIEYKTQINNINVTQLIVEISTKYNKQLNINKLINLFCEFQCYDCLYLFLDGNIVNNTRDSNIIYKYLISASKIGQFNKIELICRENDYYNPEQIRTFLLESSDIIDPRALIHVCDRHNFISELVEYLYSKEMYKFIEVYVQRMNPSSTPKVVGTLLDLNCPESQIQNLINQIRPPQCNINDLVNEVEKRNRLNILLKWLELRVNEGINDSSLHTALAKIYININNNPKHYLLTNIHYNNKIIGEYCESIDPRLSFIAYKQCAELGKCDKELVNISNKNGFYKELSVYCVERKDEDLWNIVLSNDDDDDNKDGNDNNHRRLLIDQVISTALPQSKDSEQVSCAVKSFMNNNLQHELMELLERLILNNNSNNNNNNFQNNSNLQTLLLLTAIQCDNSKIISYINNLNNFDYDGIAKICLKDEYKLYNEAFLIYKKYKSNINAVNVLLNNLEDIEKAKEFAADNCNDKDVWLLLGKSQLDNDLINESINSFLNANNAKYYKDVIKSVNKLDNDELYSSDLIKYLLMIRTTNTIRDKLVDNELIYSYSVTNNLIELKKFIISPNISASLNKVGDRIFDKKLYNAAKIIFNETNNYSKLALCLIKLEEYSCAVDIARKANNIETWKYLCFCCVDVKKFRLAQICGLNVIIFMDHLIDLIRYYEINGYFIELISLMEYGINLDRSHQGIYTELGILYAKYSENKLMEYLKLYSSKLNISSLIKVCIINQHWNEAIFLYKQYDQFDCAIKIIMDHSSVCWNNDLYKNLLIKCSNKELWYKSITFYLNLYPIYLNDLLIHLTSSSQLNHSRVIFIVENYKNNNDIDDEDEEKKIIDDNDDDNKIKPNQLSLIREYLLFIQKENLLSVNQSVNKLFIEEEDYDKLNESILNYDKFDQIKLAQQLEKLNLLEFRKISINLYRKNRRYLLSIELAKKDKLWKECIQTVKLSNNQEYAEKLLKYFVENSNNNNNNNNNLCPSSCIPSFLFICNDLISPDIVLELSWKYNLYQLSMPYFIQTFKLFNNKIELLTNKCNKMEKYIINKLKQDKQNENNKKLNNMKININLQQQQMIGWHQQHNDIFNENNRNF